MRAASEIAERFDEPAAENPIDFSKTDRAAEEWPLGGMIAHFPPDEGPFELA